jgi:hypothetical protein
MLPVSALYTEYLSTVPQRRSRDKRHYTTEPWVRFQNEGVVERGRQTQDERKRERQRGRERERERESERERVKKRERDREGERDTHTERDR